MKINYFDFGLHKGDEIRMFMDAVSGSDNLDLTVHGFEPHPFYYGHCQKRYESFQDIHIHQKAVYKSNEKVRLYLAEVNDFEGSSIFKGKSNVNENAFIEVEGIKVSDWIRKNVPDYREAINVIRFNIEGAETYLIDDLIDSGMHKHVDLWLGVSDLRDIPKCTEIAHLHSDYQKKLLMNGIIVHQFCSVSENNITNRSISAILKSRTKNKNA